MPRALASNNNIYLGNRNKERGYCLNSSPAEREETARQGGGVVNLAALQVFAVHKQINLGFL